MHVAVVGGGMAGLAAAWRLRRHGHAVTILDANADLGGRCRSFQWHGRWLIRGAAAFVGSEKNLIEQARELGVYTPEMTRDMTAQHSFEIPRGGRIHTLRQFAPAEILKSSLLPVTQKLALARVLPALLAQMVRGNDDPASAAHLDDVSACAYFRRYSPDFVDYILEPTMAMFCGYGEDDYSLAWLIWLMASDRAWANAWWTFAERGVGQLSQSLEQALRADDKATVLTDTRVRSVSGGTPWRIVAEQGGQRREIEADAVVLAVPGSLVPGIVEGLGEVHRRFFDEVRYVPHHIVYALTEPPAERGETHLMLPTAEGYEILSNLSVAPDPAGRKAFVYGEIKGDACRRMAGQSDAEIMAQVMAEVAKARPDMAGVRLIDSYVQHNDIALCSRHVGYTKALKAFRALAPLDRLAFAGDYLINSSVGSAHSSGTAAADQIIAQLKAAQAEEGERCS